MTRPSDLNWNPPSGITVEPNASKKAAGWLSSERPPNTTFNWIHKNSDEWNKYLDAFTLTEGAYNVGISYNAGTFKLVQANGSDFADTYGNRGYIVIKSSSSLGLSVVLSIKDATHLFVDASSSSDIIGEEFGTTTGVAYTESRPFYLYASNLNNTDSGLKFFISPDPTLKRTSSSTSDLGYHGNPAASSSDAGSSFFLSSSSVSSYVNVPCVLIGSFTMKKDVSDDWTVDALAASDGINKFQEYRQFIFPTGQGGASTGTYIHANGGTAPIFTKNEYFFEVGLNGFVKTDTNLSGDGGTDGSGAVSSRLSLPYQYYSSNTDVTAITNGLISAATTATGDRQLCCTIASLNSYAALFYLNSTPIHSSVENGMFTNGGRYIRTALTYRAFGV